jgi:hypothetical protein
MIAGDDHELCSEQLASPCDDRPEPVIGRRLATVSQVARKHDDVDLPVRGYERVEGGLDPLVRIDAAIQLSIGEQV